MRHVLLLAFVAFVLAGCRSETPPLKQPPATLIVGGASVLSAAGTIQSGSCCIKEGEVAIAFAPAQPGQKDLEFSWVVLLKHDWSPGPGKGQSSLLSPVVRSDSTHATAGIKIEIDGKTFELIDRFRIQMESRSLADETLEVNGKTQDLQAGRVFLVDLTAQPPTVEQRAIDLSGPPVLMENSSERIQAVALRALERVVEKDEAARKFVQGSN